MSFFGYEVKPSTAGRHRTPQGFTLKLKQVALAASAKKGEIIRFKVTIDDEEESETYVVATLIAGKHESQSIDLSFAAGETSRFEVEGNTPIHITGYYSPEDFMELGEEEEMGEDGEVADQYGEDYGEEADGESDISPEELALLREKFNAMSSSDEEEGVGGGAWPTEAIADDTSSEESDNEVMPAQPKGRVHIHEPKLQDKSLKRKRDHEHSEKKRNKHKKNKRF